MRKLLKRFAAAASAVVIGGVSCVTTWFSVPVSAAGGFGWLEWAEFESLLQGVGFSSGGGGYKNVQEATLDWLNMTSDQFYKLTDPTDGGTAKPIWEQSWWGDMTDWLDHVFGGDDGYSKVADVGAGEAGGSGSDFCGTLDSGVHRLYFSSPYTLYLNGSSRDDCAIVDWDSLAFLSDASGYPIFLYFCTSNQSLYFIFEVPDFCCIRNAIGVNKQYITVNYNSTSQFSCNDIKYIYGCSTGDFAQSGLSILAAHGIDVVKSDLKPYQFTFDNIYNSILVNPDDFVGPVYTYPAAQDLYKSTGKAAGIRRDVQTQEGVPDIQAALNGAGVDTVDDLVAGVAAGTVPMSKVFADAKVTPYVVADTATGAVVTDLGVSATAAGVKAVGLTQELAVPKDLTTAAAYTIKGKTWDPEMSKYKLPLFEYFPFCLPWDIYQVLAAFSADPVAPVFDVPVGKILSGVRSADASKAASVSAKIDFGDDNWSKVFEIIRILECAGIIVGLCLVAVYLIHGGR